MAIDGRGKLGYLIGEESCPEATDPSFRKWRSENSLITAWLLNSMVGHIQKPFMFMEAKDIWESVRETYFDLGNSSQIFGTQESAMAFKARWAPSHGVFQ